MPVFIEAGPRKLGASKAPTSRWAWDTPELQGEALKRTKRHFDRSTFQTFLALDVFSELQVKLLKTFAGRGAVRAKSLANPPTHTAIVRGIDQRLKKGAPALLLTCSEETGAWSNLTLAGAPNS